MKESEVIIVDDIPSQIYSSIIKESAKYALLSVPFTVNRMKLNDIEKRILNITKGKIAEKLFEYFCNSNSIPADFKTPSTPFYQTDKHDFLLDGFEWDIKNNFIQHNGNILTEFNYSDLPALIPDRHSKDQWVKKTKTYFKDSKGVKFLFTFLKATDKNSRKQFVEIKLSADQLNFLEKLSEKYNGKTFDQKPFEESWFWSKMTSMKDEEPSLQINDLPNLVITGFADIDLWDEFKTTNSDNESNFIDYIEPYWYRKINKKEVSLLKFMNGSIWTRIRNATVPVSKLKPFKWVFES
jgi:hypothetical protein